MIEEKIEIEHKEEFGGTFKIYGCVYEKYYDAQIEHYVVQLKYCWRKK